MVDALHRYTHNPFEKLQSAACRFSEVFRENLGNFAVGAGSLGKEYDARNSNILM
jgi:hypothetical protein